jgi:regulator of replication initiation timing
MKEINQKISEIDNNVRKLIGQLNQCRKEVEFLKEKSAELQAENDVLKQRLANNDILLTAHQIAEGIVNQTDSESIRKKLNELIREIDKCILMLEE